LWWVSSFLCFLSVESETAPCSVWNVGESGPLRRNAVVKWWKRQRERSSPTKCSREVVETSERAVLSAEIRSRSGGNVRESGSLRRNTLAKWSKRRREWFSPPKCA